MNASTTNQQKRPYVLFDHGDAFMIDTALAYGKTNVTHSTPYILKIKDLPQELKPREKMISFGPTSLTLVELLSIVLVSGTKKEDVMSIASRIVHEYGKSALSSIDRSPEDLVRELDIPLVKACQIIAAGELGRRLFHKNTQGLPTLRTPEDVYEYVRDMHNMPKEQLRGIYLDTHHKVIHDEVLSLGTINANIIHPREVFKPALQYGAAAFILVHNHPSGVSTPSVSDIQITEQIVLAGKLLGISLLDHLVVTKEGFSSVPVQYQ